MKIGITGATGFIATELIPRLVERGHECVAFSRTAQRVVAGCAETRAIRVDGGPDLSGLDACINLAGESIVGRWTTAKKRRIRESRLNLTRSLVDAMESSPVRLLVNASASGYYGDRGDETLNESSAQGAGFLADLCREWESTALCARNFGARVALLRIGFVVSPHGGAMDLVRPLFRLGLGGRLGSGKQWMPWVHVTDVVGLILHLLENESCDGAYNAAAPNSVRNAEFTGLLAASLHRPAIFPVPAFALRLALGELSTLALDSSRLSPERALASGFSFQFPHLSDAL
jgi:uncharacterized protein (TIGR01777 family)